MTNQRLRVLNFFVRHGVEKYPRALDTLAEYYRACLPDVERRLVIIDNSLDETFCQILDDDTVIIGGANTSWEFSAWDTGLQHFRRELCLYDYVHFVTSAYDQLYTAYIDKIDEEALRTLLGRNTALGHIDAYDRPVHFLGITSQSWMRSSFIFMPVFAAMGLGSMVSLKDPSIWFSDDPANPFLANAPLDDEYRANILNWLTGDGTGQGTEWHSRFLLSNSTLKYFQDKAMAIFNEHAISIRLRARGIATVDPTWLFSVRKQQSCDIFETLFDWKRQLVERKPYL